VCDDAIFAEAVPNPNSVEHEQIQFNQTIGFFLGEPDNSRIWGSANMPANRAFVI
jgi:hypothetical protein